MHNLRLLAILFMLLSASSTGYACSYNETPLHTDKDAASELTEDFTEFSNSYLTTSADNLNSRIFFPSNSILTGEDSRLLSKSRAYYSTCRYIDPGLSLPDIIFPFHTFL